MAPRNSFTIDEKVSRPIQFQEQFAKRIEEIYSDPCLGLAKSYEKSLNSGTQADQPLNIDSHKLKFFTYQENQCYPNLWCLYNYLRITFPYPETILVCEELTDIEKIKNFVWRAINDKSKRIFLIHKATCLQKSVFDQALLFLDERLAESDNHKQNTRIIITLKKITGGQKKLTVEHKNSAVNACLRG